MPGLPLKWSLFFCSHISLIFSCSCSAFSICGTGPERDSDRFCLLWEGLKWKLEPVLLLEPTLEALLAGKVAGREGRRALSSLSTSLASEAGSVRWL